MAMSQNLFGAILAMDAYNRGYGAAIPGLSDAKGTKIGDATVAASDGNATAQAHGFYAIAYLYGGQTIISFRGTDNTNILDRANDILNGWISGAGALSAQAILAEAFYDSVTHKTILSGRDSNVTLVGHSLGGGLAGYIAALTGDSAVIFDNMPYAAAALNYSIATNVNLGMTDFSAFLGGTSSPGFESPPNSTAITSIATTGEILSAIRAAAVTVGSVIEAAAATTLLTPAEGLLTATADGVTAAADAVAIQSLEASTSLDSNSGLASPIKLHSMALAVLLQYAADNGLTEWMNIGQHLFSAYFNDNIGAPLGLKASQMLSEIAYSAIDEGSMPFGDTGIRALFQEADGLGTLYSTDIFSDLLHSNNVQTDLVDISLEYAGDLAKGVDKSSAHANGAVTFDSSTDCLTADLTSTEWDINGFLPTRIVGKNDLISTISGEFSDLPSVYNIDEVVLSASESSGSALSATSDLTSADGALIVGDTGNDIITGSAGNDLLIGRGGNNLIDGGNGIDTAYFDGPAIDYDIVHDADGSWTISSARGGAEDETDTLKNVEFASFGSGEKYALQPNGILDQLDFSFVVDTTGSMSPYIAGVQDDADALINEIFGDGNTDAHISVVSFKDPQAGYPDQVVLPFTTQINLADRQQAAIAAIDSLGADGGGDIPEGDYSGLLLALNGSAGQWRDSAAVRNIVLFTDAPVKDTDLQATVDQFAANLGDTVTAGAVASVAGGQVQTFAFSASASGSSAFSARIFTVQVGNDPTATASVQQIASDTGGEFFQAPSADDLVATLTTIVSQIQIAGTVAGQTVDDNATITPFAGAGVIDPTTGETETLTVAPSSTGNGVFSVLGGGTVDPTAGVYTITGTSGQVNAALQNLVFTPTPHEVAPGQTVTTTFTLTDTNSDGTMATDSTTSVIATAVDVAGFSAFDVTTGSALPSAVQAYTGSVANLKSQYVNTTSDDINVTVTTPDWFLHSGAGNDALTVKSGTNVLDGGAGSNFLVGGKNPSGFDTFFVDDRNATSDIWSTVVNFHAGDAATIFGVTPSSATTQWVDNEGAAGYLGLTLHEILAGQPTASITLAGYSMADLSSGRLATSFGTESDGTPYLYVHAKS